MSSSSHIALDTRITDEKRRSSTEFKGEKTANYFPVDDKTRKIGFRKVDGERLQETNDSQKWSLYFRWAKIFSRL